MTSSTPAQAVDPATSGDEDDHDQEVIVGGLALGNRVWYDANDSGTIDGVEQGIENVLVEVYAVDNTGTPAAAPTGADTTDADGYWLVDNLPPGDYIAVVPASNFATQSDPLWGMSSSSDIASSGDPENSQESDDNGIGIVPSSTISSSVVTLDPVAGEPEQSGPDEGDLGPGHGNAGDFFDNLTVDFGFLRYDLGDVPDSYTTLVGSSGPRHILDDVTFLGAIVDAEAEGQPSDNADGDDDPSDSDDEDGVQFLSPIMAGEAFTIEVTASADGYLNSWMDFDGNGTFDPAEQLTNDALLSAGANTLVFTAPASVDDDNLYSRFRFTADAGQATTPSGDADSGEIEDYVLMSLGNRVFLDADGTDPADVTDDGAMGAGEMGIDGVVVELYDADDTPGVDAPIATTTTDADGLYLFTGLDSDEYVVCLPGVNFDTGQPLEGLTSSSDSGSSGNVDPNTDEDDEGTDENGVDDADPASNGISSL